MTDRQVELAILERRKNVAQRYVRGQTQWEIARAFEVDQATISRDLAAIQAEWLSQAVLDVGTVRARELARIDEVERQAWIAWLKSQENAETSKERTRGPDGTQTVTEKVSKGQAGDPRYLEIVLKCVERRCKILGVDTSKPGTPDEPADTDARRNRLARLVDSLRERGGVGGDRDAPDGPAPASDAAG